ncbi:MAG TPA: EAL domain-containing protein [Candidatus Limnocylindrales bacterium]|nr:EAL domain-containing protein [Candidatus Limnocylindrales bacterium]
MASISIHGSVAPGMNRWRATAIGVGAAIVAVFAFLPATTATYAMFVATSAAATALCLISARAGRPLVPGAWHGVAAALAMLTAGNAITLIVMLTGLDALRGGADVLFMLAYIPLFAATYRFGRGTRRVDRTVILDTAIVGLSAMPIVWKVLVQPHVSSVSGGAAMAALALPVIDIMLVSLAVPLVLLRRARSASGILLLAGLLAMAAGDSVFAIGTIDGDWAAPLPMKVLWLLSYLLLASSATVPSARRLGGAPEERQDSTEIGRTLVLGAGIVVAPLATLETALFGRADGELTAFAVLSVAVASLVVLRLQRTVGQMEAADRRFRRFMDHDGILAVIKDRSGRYLYRSASADRRLGTAATEWLGRTDGELFDPALAEQRRNADARVRATGTALTETYEADGHTWHTERFAIPGQHGEVGVLGVDITERIRAQDEVRFQAHLLESVRDAVVVVDVDGRLTYWNRGAQEIFKRTREDMLGTRLLDVVDAGARDQVKALWEAVRRGVTELGDMPFTDADGQEMWLSARVSPITELDGAPAGVLAIIKDITERKTWERELHRLDAAMANTSDAILITDEHDRVAYVNPAFERMTGVTATELIGSSAADALLGHGFANALAQARNRQGSWRGDLIERRRDGTDLVAQTTISPIGGGTDTWSGFVTIKRDVTHERAAERAAERRGRERALIAETLGSLRAGDSPEETAAAVCAQTLKVPELHLTTMITFGADGIATVLAQRVQDRQGAVGRSLTPERSAYLRSRAAAGPWVERWVSDPTNPYDELFREFGIVAHAYAPLIADDQPIGILIAGCTLPDSLERLTERLPAIAEFASIATTLLADAVSSRNASAAARRRLREVIAKTKFRSVFQPIVDLATGVVRGYEALTRFDDGTPPDVEFHRAVDLGLGLELDRACLASAFEAAASLPADAWLNVNVSPETVLSGVVESTLPGDTRRAVVLEITEHHAITDYEAFRAAVSPIRDRVQVAVDDAGAGFASLRHIVELAPAMVKLDRSLVAGIGTDPARQAVVAGMVKFAQAADLLLIAEGIETDDELDVLRRLGIPLGQGYLLAVPSPAPATAPPGATHPPATAGRPRRSDRARRPSSRASGVA